MATVKSSSSRTRKPAVGKPGGGPATPPAAVVTDKPVTDVSEWRSGRKEGFVIELPSGKVARVRRTMDMLKLLEKGKIPNPLADVIRKSIKTQTSSLEMKDAPEGAMEQLVDLINSQLPKLFIEPSVEVEPEDWDEEEKGIWEPSPDAIAVDDIEMDDRMYVFAFAQGRAVDVASFREAKEAYMASLANVGPLASPPVGPTGD